MKSNLLRFSDPTLVSNSLHGVLRVNSSILFGLLSLCIAFSLLACLGSAKAESPASNSANVPASTQTVALTPLRVEIYGEDWIDLNKDRRKDPYEDSSLEVELRIDDLLSQMTVEEKTCQLATLYGYQRVLKQDLPDSSWKEQVWKDGIANIDEHLNGIPGWRDKQDSEYVWPPSQHARAINEVQKWFVEETRLGIPVDFTNEGIRGLCYRRATNFPAQIGLGATWDRDLIVEIGQVTGVEAKSVGYTHLYSPILDLARDPRWGRVVECYGEDPFLVATLGTAQIEGLHRAGVGSTCKHYAAYGVPKGGRDGNARTDPKLAPRELQQMYLKPFEAVIRSGRLEGVMSSYNDYDAVPVSASSFLLTDHLRTRMGFRGYVVSDSGAVRDLNQKHRVASTKADATKQFLEAGGNVRTAFNDPKSFVFSVRELLNQGTISLDVVDARVRDVLRVKFHLGLFDSPYVNQPDEADQLVHCAEHQAVALDAARKSMTLLKNENDTLPLRKEIKSILVCGPNALSVGPCISRYGPTMGEVVTVLDGIRETVSTETRVLYAKGCEVVDDSWPESEIFPMSLTTSDESLLDEALKLAEQVEVIVAVLGESEHTIGESKSRTDLNLTGHQNKLVQRLHATGKPVVVVLINGRALSINWIDRYVPAVLEAWFPGEACGTAIAEVLFGDYNPGGKLPVTVPRSVGQLPYNFPFKPGSQAGQGKGHNPNGVGNSRVTGSIYPFGHGLSYTNFAFRDLQIAPAVISPGESVTVSCSVENTGQRTGDEVVQLYLRDDISSVVTYEHTLCGFERVTLEPGESRTVTLPIDRYAMELIDRQLKRTVEPGSFKVSIGSSSEDIRLQGSFKVTESQIATAQTKQSSTTIKRANNEKR